MSGIVLTFVLLALNGYFVWAEFALLAVRRAQLQPLADAGSRGAARALRALGDMPRMLAAAQLGITLCSLGLGAVAEPAIAVQLEPLLHKLGLPDAALHPVAFTVALALVVYLHVVLGEMVPKNIALATPERSAIVLTPPLILVATLSAPIIMVVNTASRLILRLFGVEMKDGVESTITLAQVASIVDESQREGLMEEDEVDLITGALDFDRGITQDHMIAVKDLVTLPAVAPVELVERLISETGFSRFPILAEGQVLGYVHIKDVLEEISAPSTESESESAPVEIDLSARCRPLESVPPTASLRHAVMRMSQTHRHMVRISTVTGVTVGVLFLEDVLEELVGEVRDSLNASTTTR